MREYSDQGKSMRNTSELRFSLLIPALLLAACSAPANDPTQPAAPPAGSATDIPAASTAEIPDGSPGQTQTAMTEDPGSETQSIEVTYFTPQQMEGPYYPVEKPSDRDNDLVALTGASGQPSGEVLVINGVVYDANGNPLEGVVVEIWQADPSGAYDHPNDPSTGGRDLNFQFYGESRTGVDGVYSFRTLLPGLYGNRPRHIHVKVRMDGTELLTTQFYFAHELILQGDEANLLVVIAPAEDDDGQPIWVGERDIVLNFVR